MVSLICSLMELSIYYVYWIDMKTIPIISTHAPQISIFRKTRFSWIATKTFYRKHFIFIVGNIQKICNYSFNFLNPSSRYMITIKCLQWKMPWTITFFSLHYTIYGCSLKPNKTKSSFLVKKKINKWKTWLINLQRHDKINRKFKMS